MPISVLVLFVSSAAAAVCQSIAPVPADPQQPWSALPQWVQPGRGFNALPPQWHITTSLPSHVLLVPNASPLHPSFDAQIDPKILVHPPPSSLGEQPPGTQIAQNVYPGLMLLPVDEWKGKGQQIPIKWPNLKVQSIPTIWPKLEIKPAASGATKPAEK